MNPLEKYLQRIKECEAKATSGFWFRNPDLSVFVLLAPSLEPKLIPANQADAEFIALSRNSMPALIQVVEILREALEVIDKNFYSDGCDMARSALSACSRIVGGEVGNDG